MKSYTYFCTLIAIPRVDAFSLPVLSGSNTRTSKGWCPLYSRSLTLNCSLRFFCNVIYCQQS